MGDIDAFDSVTRQWLDSNPQSNVNVHRGPTYDYTMNTSRPKIDVTVNTRRKTRETYSVPAEFKTLLKQPFLCVQCDSPERADCNPRTPHCATHIAVLCNGTEFRPVCPNCQNLHAHNYRICIDGHIPISLIIKS